MRYGLALVSVLIATLAAAAAGSAEPTQLNSKRAEAQQVLAQVQAMDAQLEKAVEAWNGANVRLDQIQHDLATNRARLEVARKNLTKARARVSARVVALYTTEQPDALSVILGASSLGDLIERLDSASRIAADDARIAAEVTRYRNEVQKHQAELVKAEAAQQKVVAERAAQRASIESQLAARQTLYSSIKDQIAKLEAAERERQARLAAQAKAAANHPHNAPAPAPAPAPVRRAALQAEAPRLRPRRIRASSRSRSSTWACPTSGAARAPPGSTARA